MFFIFVLVLYCELNIDFVAFFLASFLLELVPDKDRCLNVEYIEDITYEFYLNIELSTRR